MPKGENGGGIRRLTSRGMEDKKKGVKIEPHRWAQVDLTAALVNKGMLGALLMYRVSHVTVASAAMGARTRGSKC